MFSMSPSIRLTRLAFVTGLLSQLVLGVTINDVFIVKEGTENGGCDAFADAITQAFEDSIKLADIAAAGIATTDDKTREYLDTFFNIKPGEDTSTAAGYVSQVKAILDNSRTLPSGKPWLFCDSTWVEEQAWDSVVKNADGTPQEDGQTVEEKYPETEEHKTEFRPFWSSDLSQYISLEPGDYCSTRGNQGATQDLIAPNTVTLCMNNFPPTQASGLAQIAPVAATGVSIKDRQANSLTLFHEMFHLSSGSAITPDHSYKLVDITNFDTDTAVQNPESYSFYALAFEAKKQKG
ncbi:hypothetical protein G7Z17_g4719 [Cylindrodendrum hubeiense]|uniref:Lysine-specific metallo-endopeptidase domain-containing protein n=1 Tax=Cylindrodendrum hubeiense TaxID=595255 RepID=A0A9P5H892_9HYPO|nr:hypothetical protein G7Z17_g4719 [Cylindrodendrum hubeiense]